MSRRDRIFIALMLVVIALLAIGVFSLTNKIANLENSIQSVANAQKLEPKVIHGKDGNDGLSIKGDDGDHGTHGIDGQNAISTFEKEVIIKEVPLAPMPPKEPLNGKDAPIQEIRLNPENNNLESKMSDTTFWSILVPCEKLIVSCVADTVSKSVKAL